MPQLCSLNARVIAALLLTARRRCLIYGALSQSRVIWVAWLFDLLFLAGINPLTAAGREQHGMGIQNSCPSL